jgi:hypothetical protein
VPIVPIVVPTTDWESKVRSLAGFTAERAPVTTCYLDIDGRRHLRQTDIERHASAVLRGGRARLNGRGEDPSVVADLRRIEEHVRAGVDRHGVKGLAFFACSAHDLFEVFALPANVHDRVVVNHTPAVGQLEAILSHHEPIGVLLADRQRVRMFVFALGELAERSELLDELPRDYDAVGERDRGTTDAHVDALVRSHLRHAADVAWRVYADHPFVHFAVGAPDALVGELESLLHPYLRERLCGRVGVTVGASMPDIRQAAEELEQEAERRREMELVERLRAAAASNGGRGVVGLGPTLAAVSERRAEVLLVSDGYEEEGWRCPDTGALAAVGPTSPLTGARMERVDDVVEDAIDLALETGCRVVTCTGNADLDVLGRIGALLRY